MTRSTSRRVKKPEFEVFASAKHRKYLEFSTFLLAAEQLY
jgi:hypothetical protein